MALLLTPTKWTRQPQTPAGINPLWQERGLVYAWNFSGRQETLTRENIVPSSGDFLSPPGPAGRSLETPTANTSALAARLLASSSGMPTAGCTIILMEQRLNTSRVANEANFVSFSVGTPASLTSELHAFIPYSDNNVYWRYGNGTGIAVAQTIGTEVNVWGFIAGTADGRAIWRNGARIAKDTTLITRTSSSSAFSLGVPDALTGSAALRRYMMAVFANALTEGEMVALTSNLQSPWQIWADQPRRMWFGEAAAGGFVPAWAFGSNAAVIGSGIHA